MKVILKPENVSRKVDNLGRITFPKGLRQRYLLDNGPDLDLFTATIEGRECIILALPEEEKMRVRSAVQSLAEAGIELTDEQMAILVGEDEDED